MLNQRQAVASEVRAEVPEIRKPEAYADVLLRALSLGALNRTTARDRRTFLKSTNITASIFQRCYTVYDFLVKHADPNSRPVVMSERTILTPEYIFSPGCGSETLEHERSLMLKHIKADPHLQDVVAKYLKIPHGSIDGIARKLVRGNLFKQVRIYNDVFQNIIRNGIAPKGYVVLKVVTIPVSKYCLGNLGRNVLERARR